MEANNNLKFLQLIKVPPPSGPREDPPPAFPAGPAAVLPVVGSLDTALRPRGGLGKMRRVYIWLYADEIIQKSLCMFTYMAICRRDYKSPFTICVRIHPLRYVFPGSASNMTIYTPP